MANTYRTFVKGVKLRQDTTTGFNVTIDVGTPTADRTLTAPDGTAILVGDTLTQTLTNKTLSGNTAASLINSTGTINFNSTGVITVPNATDTLVGKATTDTLTNKTLTAPIIATIVNTGTLTLPTSTDTLVGRATTDSLTNKTISGTTNTISVLDTKFTLQDNADPTRQAIFELSNISTGTTRTFAFPDESTTFVGKDVAQTLNFKSLVDSTTFFIDDGDATKRMSFQISGVTSGLTRTLTVPDANTTLVGTDTTQSLTNKTLDNTNTITLKDTLFTLQDDGDTSKQLKFQLSGITTATTRTLTAPDASTTIVGTDTTQTLTNKTLTSPTLTTPTTDIVTWDDQSSTPSNPASGFYKTYFKTDGNFYKLNSAGSETLLGGGIFTTYATQNIASNAAVTLDLTLGFQYRRVAGSGGAVQANDAPLGSSAPTDGVVVRLVGTSDTNTVTFRYIDAAKGFLLNGQAILGLGDVLTVQYDSVLDRYVEVSRNF